MAFKFRIQKGIRVKQDLFDKLVEARNERTHGDVLFVECAEGKFLVHTTRGTFNMKAFGDEEVSSIRLCNMLNADIQAEPERREVYKAVQAEKPAAVKIERHEPEPAVRREHAPRVTPRSEHFHRPRKGDFARW